MLRAPKGKAQGSGSWPDREYVFNISRFLSLPTYLSGALVCPSKWHPTYLWMQRAAGAKFLRGSLREAIFNEFWQQTREVQAEEPEVSISSRATSVRRARAWLLQRVVCPRHVTSNDYHIW